MLIGDSFNKKYKKFLRELAETSQYEAGKRVEVSTLLQMIDLEKAEFKSMMEFLESLGYLKIETIGGKFLYGHVSITKKGLAKLSK